MKNISNKQIDMQSKFLLSNCILEVMSTGPNLQRPTDEVAVGPEAEEVDVLSATPLSHQSMFMLLGVCAFTKLNNN